MRRILAFSVLSLTGLAEPVAAQTLEGRDRWADSVRVAIEAATVASRPEGFRHVQALIERALTGFPNDPLLQHYQGYALYREASLMQGLKRRPEDIRSVLAAAQDALERSLKRLDMPETHALRASVIGQLIGTSPLRGMTLGPRSSAAMDRALELGPANPRVWLMRGMSAMFTPAMFGGGRDKADAYLAKSIELFATDAPAPPAPAWGHADAWIWLGQLRRQQGRTADARKAYNTALEIQPDNRWVRTVLLPSLDRVGR